MIVGKGMIANSLLKYQYDTEILIFASGVSNSKEMKLSEFERELNLLKEYTNHSSRIIYFSTCSVYDKSVSMNPYVQHKLNAEKFIMENFSKYLILRLPTVVGFGDNQTTLFNYFKLKLLKKEIIKINLNAHRYLMDVSSLKEIIKCLLKFYKMENKIVNAAFGNKQSVHDIVLEMAKILKVRPIVELFQTSSEFTIDNKEFLKIMTSYELNIPIDYNSKLIIKYL